MNETKSVLERQTLLLERVTKAGGIIHYGPGAFRSAHHFADEVGEARTAEVLAMTDSEFSALIKERYKAFKPRVSEEVK